MSTRFVFLASKSPRRSELLRQIGVAHEVIAPATVVDETPRDAETPDAYVERLARAKAEAGWAHLSREVAAKNAPSHPVLAADTTVALGHAILGKPSSDDEAVAMIAQLSGRTHHVYTAIAVASPAGINTALSRSSVTMRAITDDEARRYVAIGESADKAGAYAIQGHAAMFVERIDGSYSGVMGLPLFETAKLLAEAGLVLP
jgi:septum formation protein